MGRTGQVLLIDADDTLWENNLRFTRTIEAFLKLVAPLGYEDGYVRRLVARAEEKNIRHRGYGMSSFLVTLEEVYLKLASPRAVESRLEEVRRLSRFLVGEPPQIFEGVVETLAHLAGRHRLLLFSKGNDGEQRQKVASSGLARHFELCEIVSEKNEAAYRAVVERHGLAPQTVWMVGDSPRSDINPALAAGLNAVYIPSPHPWEYEEEAIRRGSGQLLVLKEFRELQEHF